MMTAIEMARECATCGQSKEGNPFCSDGFHILPQWQAACNELLSMRFDHPEKPYPTGFVHSEEVREAAQIMRNEIVTCQAEIDAKNADITELVEALEAAVKVLQCLEPQPNISAQGVSLTALLAKHGGVDANPIPA